MGFTTTIIAGTAAVLIGSLVQGAAALGFALIVVPMMVIFLPPQTTMPVLLVLGMVVNSCVLWEARKSLRFRSMIWVTVFGALATPLGAYLLVWLEADTIKVLIGIVVTLVAILFLIGFQRKIRREKLAAVPVGITSGVLQGSLTMSGPPVILFLVNQGTEKKVFRANNSAFAMVMNIAAFASYLLSGLMTAEVFRFALYFSPGIAVGTLGGIYLSRHINEAVFRRIALIVVALGGVSAALAGLGIW